MGDLRVRRGQQSRRLHRQKSPHRHCQPEVRHWGARPGGVQVTVVPLSPAALVDSQVLGGDKVPIKLGHPKL